jgi:hypothetical protein
VSTVNVRLDDTTPFRVVVGPLEPGSVLEPYASLVLFPGVVVSADDPEMFDALAVRASEARDGLAEAILRRQR